MEPEAIGRAARIFRTPPDLAHVGWSPTDRIFYLAPSAGLIPDANQPNHVLHVPRAQEVVWHSGGRIVALLDRERLCTFDTAQERIQSSTTFADPITSVAWSPAGDRVAVGLADGSIQICDARDLDSILAYRVVGGGRLSCHWEPSDNVAFSDEDGSVGALDASNGRLKSVDPLSGLPRWTRWFGKNDAAIGHDDGTIQVFSQADHSAVYLLENPRGDRFVDIALMPDSSHLFTLDEHGIVDIYRCDGLSLVNSMATRVNSAEHGDLLGVTNSGERIAYAGGDMSRVYVHDLGVLFARPEKPLSVQYQNAKVVLVGETGVGKSGLARTLMGLEYAPTDSTHARTVGTLRTSTERKFDSYITQEVLLWDLAGQPGYRSFHKLSLRDVSVGLVVFDARSESDPFKGVPYWSCALKDANSSGSCRSLLVSARADRGPLAATRQRIESICARYGFDRVFETSSRTGEGVPELLAAVTAGVDWSELPIIVAPESFLRIREFLVTLKAEGRLIARTQELQKLYLASSGDSLPVGIFETCLERLEAAGLVFKLSSQASWLLQPELLDSYVAYLAHAARSEPDGLGTISESRALSGDYRHDELEDHVAEKAMLLTSVEETVGQGLALRVPTDEGTLLVFPAERRTSLREFTDRFDSAVEYFFTGTVSAVYAALAVKLSNSTPFIGEQIDLYHNAAVFTRDGESSGFFVRVADPDDESEGRLVAFFSPDVKRSARVTFLEYLEFQLYQLVHQGQVRRNRLHTHCGEAIPPTTVAKRLELGHTNILCGVCGESVAVDDLSSHRSGGKDRSLTKRDRQASTVQEVQRRRVTMPQRESAGLFHAFVCHNSVDRAVVLELERQLRDLGIVSWVDRKTLGPGSRNLREIEEAIENTPATLVCVGATSMGAWQEEEYYAALTRAVRSKSKGRRAKLIPVLLPGASITDLPAFLATRTVADFSDGWSDAEMQRLAETLA